uniref:Ig-like domain-containing protein n=1 Tax=Neogobius melanostomus TaxID=47308 RepID=A0A8C6UQ55_9GOBI
FKTHPHIVVSWGNCETEIRVRRDTSHNVSVGDRLKISCPVSFCDNSPPSVTWFKLETDEYEPVNMSDRVRTEWEIKALYFLIFLKVLSSDSGQYQCQSGNSASHFTHVVVTGKTSDMSDHKYLKLTVALFFTRLYVTSFAQAQTFYTQITTSSKGRLFIFTTCDVSQCQWIWTLNGIRFVLINYFSLNKCIPRPRSYWKWVKSWFLF